MSDEKFGGSGNMNGVLKAEKMAEHGRDFSISFKLAPLAVQVFVAEKALPKAKKAK